MVGITNILGTIGNVGSDEELFGKKPIVPDYPDIYDSQIKSLRQNQAILPEAQAVTASINRFNQQQILEMMREAMPNYDAINQKASDNILSGLRGELPQDVQNLIQDKAASRSVSGGYSQSGMGRNLGLRDLGLNSLAVTNKAMDSASRWMMQQRQIAAPESFDVSNMFISPAQRFAADQGKFERDMFAANIEAAPDPAKRGAWDTEMEFIGMVLSAYGGGAGYKGAYQGNNGGGGASGSLGGGSGGGDKSFGRISNSEGLGAYGGSGGGGSGRDWGITDF